MKIRGISRLAAAAAATALLVGGFASPARADYFDSDVADLTVEEPVTAIEFPTKGCEGIGTGQAVPASDGWLFSKPAGQYKDLEFLFLYIDPEGGGLNGLQGIVVKSSGVYGLDWDAPEPTDPTDVQKLTKASAKAKVKKLAADLTAKADDGAWTAPTVPAPAGVTGAFTGSGAWLRTPASWWISGGVAFSDPLLPEGTFDLIRACPAATTPSASASPAPSVSPSPSAGPQLPVTGTNVWFLTGGGVALIAIGAVLFMAYRRRQSVKFVA